MSWAGLETVRSGKFKNCLRSETARRCIANLYKLRKSRLLVIALYLDALAKTKRKIHWPNQRFGGSCMGAS
jgi:hypothetical protein